MRRKSITDGFTLVGFLAGFFGAAWIAWPNLKWGFDTGPVERGLTYSILILLVTGVLGAAAGGGLGMLVGRLWAAYHNYRRGGAVVSATAPSSVASPRRTGGSAAAPAVDRRAQSSLDPSIRFENGFDGNAFLGLLQRVFPEPHDATRAAAALARTTNIGAWDQGELVGAARVLTDGYFHAAITELVVHPQYRRRGIGRELLRRALDVAPRGALTVTAQPASVGFLEHLGGERGPSGFVVRRANAAALET